MSDSLVILGHFLSILFGYAAQTTKIKELCVMYLSFAFIGALAGPYYLYIAYTGR